MTAFQEAQAIVNKYFDGDAKKITLWWNTENPLLGGVTPSSLYELFGAEKLLKHIKHWQAGETP